MQQKGKGVDTGSYVTIEEWLLMIVLGLIPGINLIVMGFLSFRRGLNPNKKNFARAAFGFGTVLTVLILIGVLY